MNADDSIRGEQSHPSDPLSARNADSSNVGAIHHGMSVSSSFSHGLENIMNLCTH